MLKDLPRGQGEPQVVPISLSKSDIWSGGKCGGGETA